MTHSELVAIARRWLLGSQRCSVVITEMASGASEHPDAIGWKVGLSILVECKTSRADFLADAQKHFRRRPNHAMGVQRFFLAPPGIISPEEVPAPWGLLEARGSRVFLCATATLCTRTDRAYEIELLISACRRLIAVPGVQGVNCRTYGPDETGKERAEIYVSGAEQILAAGTDHP